MRPETATAPAMEMATTPPVPAHPTRTLPSLSWLEKLTVLFFFLATLNPELVDINFFGRAWYRGTTRGIEVGYIDVLYFILLLFLLQRNARRPLYLPRAFLLLLVFVGYCTLNILFSDPRLFGVYELSKIVRGVLVFFIIANLCRSEQDLRWMVFCLCCAVIWEGLDALDDRYRKGYHRVPGTFDHSNSLSMYMALGGVTLLSLAFTAERFRLRILGLTAFAMAGVSTLLTISRMGLASLIMGAMCVVFFSLRKRIGGREILTVLPLALCGVVALAMAMDTIMSRMDETDLEAEYAGAENEGRGVYIRLCQLAVKDYPLGVGLNNWSYRMTNNYAHRIGLNYHRYRGTDIIPPQYTLPNMDAPQAAPAHNLFVLVLGELGWPGLVLFVLIWFRFMFMSLGFAFSGRGDLATRFATGVFGALMALTIQGITEWEYRQTPIFLLYHALMGMLVAVAHMRKQERPGVGSTSGEATIVGGTPDGLADLASHEARQDSGAIMDFESGVPHATGWTNSAAADAVTARTSGTDHTGTMVSARGTGGESSNPERKLPFDPITVLVRLALFFWIPATVAVVAGLVARGQAKPAPPVYRAHAVCRINEKALELASGYQPTAARTLIDMMQLPSVLKAVASEVKTGDRTAPVAGHVEVEEDRRSGWITVFATADRPETAARLADTVIQVGGQRIVRDRRETARQALSHYQQTEAALRARLERAEQTLEKLGEVDISIQASQSQARLGKLDLEVERLAMRAQSVDLRLEELDRAARTLKPSDGQKACPTSMLRDLMLHATELRLEKASLWREIEDLKTLRGRAEARVRDLPERARTFWECKREIGVLEALLLEIRLDQQKADNADQLDVEPFVVVEPALVPLSPEPSSRRAQVLGSAAAGFFLGLIGLLAWLVVRPGLRSTRSVQRLTGLPVAWRVAWQRAREPRSERLDRVRDAQLLFAGRADVQPGLPGSVLVVTGSGRGVGKSLMADALASTITCLGWKPVVLRLGRGSSVGAGPDLTRFLLEPGSGLAHVPLGELHRGTLDLDRLSLAHLTGARWQGFLARFRGTDHVLVLDGPDLVPGVEAGVLSRRADLVFLVVHAGRSRRRAVRECMSRLPATGTRYVVVNALRWPFTRLL